MQNRATRDAAAHLLDDRGRRDGNHPDPQCRQRDVALAASDLDYLIVRPGTLTDDDGTGSINAGVSVAYDTISRDDVAGFIAASVFTPYLNRVAVGDHRRRHPHRSGRGLQLEPRPTHRCH